jgi:hypothetical protein
MEVLMLNIGYEIHIPISTSLKELIHLKHTISIFGGQTKKIRCSRPCNFRIETKNLVYVAVRYFAALTRAEKY